MTGWDVFISYASEDRKSLAEPLAIELERAGLRVWFDRGEVSAGDRLLREINDGLAQSRYGLVILSPDFVKKQWPRDELAALFARDTLLPVVHRMTAQDLADSLPLIAGRRLIEYDGSSFAELVATIVKEIGPPASPAAVSVDFSHRQREWWHLANAFDDESRFFKSTESLLRGAWKDASVLVAPPPYHEPWIDGEVSAIESWVHDGGGLLILGYYAGPHHETSMGTLAWPFDFEFRDDLLMPAGTKAADRDISSRSVQNAVRLEVPDDSPCGRDVGEVHALHACSVVASSYGELALRLSVPPGTQSWRPVGHITQGNRPNITGYELERLAPKPTSERIEPSEHPIDVVLARSHGRGRVAVAGTWKLFTVETPGNSAFLTNLLSWLSGADVGNENLANEH